MLFWLKKFISFWLMPLSICVAAMLAGLVLARCTKRVRLGRALVLAGLGLLLVCSNRFVGVRLLRPLETRHAPMPEFSGTQPPPADLAACRYVVVLGGGNGHTPGMAATNLLSRPALSRLAEGVRLLRVLPEAKLIVSGPASGGRAAHATVLARAAQSLGVAPERIVHIDHARDTEDEAEAVQRLAPGGRVAVVTSAWHMPRSIALFQGAGLAPVACPADFRTHADEDFSFEDVLWDVGSLECSTLAVRERIGYLWIWLRGKG